MLDVQWGVERAGDYSRLRSTFTISERDSPPVYGNCYRRSYITNIAGGDIGEFTSQEVIVSDQTVSVGDAGYLFCAGVGNPAPVTKFLTVSPALPGVLGPTTRYVVQSLISHVISVTRSLSSHM